MNKYMIMVRKIPKEKSNKMKEYIKIFIIPYLYEAHVSGDTPPIIRILKRLLDM
jgi:hypothetical protein